MNIKNILLTIVGFLSLSLGTAGIFLPVLPTTPFFLLAAGCFSAGSPRMEAILMRNRYFGSYIENYRHKTGVPRIVKIRAIFFLWTGLIISMVLIKTLFLTVLLTFIGICVTIHIGKLKTRS